MVMGAAQIILALLQVSRLGIEIVEKYQRGEMTEEELDVAWKSMQLRLEAASARVQAS